MEPTRGLQELVDNVCSQLGAERYTNRVRYWQTLLDALKAHEALPNEFKQYEISRKQSRALRMRCLDRIENAVKHKLQGVEIRGS